VGKAQQELAQGKVGGGVIYRASQLVTLGWRVAGHREVYDVGEIVFRL